MIEDIKNKIEQDTLVLLCEEYGYRSWFWFPDMNFRELILWWENLETVSPYFMTPEPLPGTLKQIQEEDEFDLFHELKEKKEYFTAHIHCDDDSILITPDGKKIRHKGFEEN